MKTSYQVKQNDDNKKKLFPKLHQIWSWGWRVGILGNREQRNTIRTEAFFFPHFLPGHCEKLALGLVPSPKGGCWQAHNSRGL